MIVCCRQLKLIVPIGIFAITFFSNTYANNLIEDSLLSPTAIVPKVNYKSAFDDYSAFSIEEVASWHDLNEQVKGGHASHDRHSMQPINSTDNLNQHQHE